MVARSIEFFEKFLEIYGFLRVHRSFMINPNYIEMYNVEKDVMVYKPIFPRKESILWVTV